MRREAQAALQAEVLGWFEIHNLAHDPVARRHTAASPCV